MAENRVKIAPSILAADFSRLADEIRRIEEAGADQLHIDVMDGHFVDNLTVGLPVIESIRRITRLPIDAHLMIQNPGRYATQYADAGADWITFHVETVAFDYALRRGEMGYSIDFLSRPLIDFERANRIIDEIHERGSRAGIALNPATMVEVLEGELIHRVDLLLVMTVWPGFGGRKFIPECAAKARLLRVLNRKADIGVDGGITPDNAGRCAAEGANVLVAGTAIFQAPDLAGAIRALRRSAESAPAQSR